MAELNGASLPSASEFFTPHGRNRRRESLSGVSMQPMMNGVGSQGRSGV